MNGRSSGRSGSETYRFRTSGLKRTGIVPISRPQQRNRVMRAVLTSAMLWRFIGGFALGGIGVLTLHPAAAQVSPHAPVVASVQPAQR
jgi:hypothetical protein